MIEPLSIVVPHKEFSEIGWKALALWSTIMISHMTIFVTRAVLLILNAIRIGTKSLVF